MSPDDVLIEIFLDLLREALVPSAIVAAVGTMIALYQFAKSQADMASQVENFVVQTFSSSSRRMRSLAVMIIAQAAALTATLVLTGVALRDTEIAGLIGSDKAAITSAVQAGGVAFFIAVDWWSLRKGDELPAAVTFWLVGSIASSCSIGYAIYLAVPAGTWLAALPPLVIGYLWFKLVDWAVSSGSSLARAYQR